MSRILMTLPAVSSKFCRLDVAVNETALGSMLKTQRRLADVIAGLGHRQRAVLLDQRGQVDGPVDVFHDQQVRAADLVGVIGQHDVRMRQRRRGPHFALEPADGVGIIQSLFADKLDGDDAAQLPVAGLEDLSHAAFAHTLPQNIGTQQEFLARPCKS